MDTASYFKGCRLGLSQLHTSRGRLGLSVCGLYGHSFILQGMSVCGYCMDTATSRDVGLDCLYVGTVWTQLHTSRDVGLDCLYVGTVWTQLHTSRDVGLDCLYVGVKGSRLDCLYVGTVWTQTQLHGHTSRDVGRLGLSVCGYCMDTAVGRLGLSVWTQLHTSRVLYGHSFILQGMRLGLSVCGYCMDTASYFKGCRLGLSVCGYCMDTASYLVGLDCLYVGTTSYFKGCRLGLSVCGYCMDTASYFKGCL